MELLASDSMRLIYTLGLGVGLFCAAAFFARRWFGGDWVKVGADALLLTFAAQYVSVGLPGLLRVLSPVAVGGMTVVCIVGLVGLGLRRPTPVDEESLKVTGADFWIPAACTCVLLGFAAALVEATLYIPPMSIDALVYHFSAPADWLQKGRIDIFPLYYGPANSYSPLGGSTYIGWYLALAGNDTVAKYVQLPPLVLVFLTMVLAGRGVGVRDAVSAPVALAAVLSKSLVTEAWLAKDDLYAAGYFMCIIAAFATMQIHARAERSDSPRSDAPGPGRDLTPWMVGLALGLLLSTKFTVLFSIPILLLLLPVPVRARWGWKQYATVLGLAFVLGGPWYLRNLILQGNPLYPVELRAGGMTLLPGLFEMQRSPDVRSLHKLKEVFLDRYHSVALPVGVAVVSGWAVAVVMNAKRLLREPAVALVLVGPVVGVGLFLARALYPEIRFLYPTLVLMFVATAMAFSRVACGARVAWVPWVGSIGLALLSICLAFPRHDLIGLLPIAAAVAVVAMGLVATRRFLRLSPGRVAGVFAALSLVPALFIYVYGDAYVRDYFAGVEHAWEGPYREAPAWTYVRRHLPEDATVAFANSNISYPLQGGRFTRKVVIVPARADVPDFLHLPRTGKRITGEQMIGVMGELLQQNPDGAAWMSRLREKGARYLYVAKGSLDKGGAGMVEEPVELKIVAERPKKFRKLFETPLAVVYEIVSP